MNKIIAVYKITNTITGDFYIGSSKDVKRRWADHKCKSIWKRCPNNPMYQDMNKYGLDKFEFEILEEVEVGQLKEAEQEFIETLKPTYNNYNAKGWDIERLKEYQKQYQEDYRQSNKGKEYHRKYNKSDKGKESKRKYDNQLCLYNDQTLTLHALSERFRRQGIDHPNIEAKKYLIKSSNE